MTVKPTSALRRIHGDDDDPVQSASQLTVLEYNERLKLYQRGRLLVNKAVATYRRQEYANQQARDIPVEIDFRALTGDST